MSEEKKMILEKIDELPEKYKSCHVLRISTETFGELLKSMQEAGQAPGKKVKDFSPDEWKMLVQNMQKAVKVLKK